MPLVGVFVRALLTGLAWLIRSQIAYWIASGMTALGLAFGTSTLVIEPVIDQVVASYTGLPADILAGLAYVGVPEALSIILSAVATRVGFDAGKLYLMRTIGNGGNP